jgi:hypothetical protein
LQHAYAVDVQVARKVVKVYSSRPFLHCNAKEHGLSLAYAVAVGKKLYFPCALLEKTVTQF